MHTTQVRVFGGVKSADGKCSIDAQRALAISNTVVASAGSARAHAKGLDFSECVFLPNYTLITP